MKKFIFSAAIAAMLCTACSEGIDEVKNTTDFDTFSADILSSRTDLADDNSVFWTEGDLVSIFNKTTENLEYEAVDINGTHANLKRKSGMRGSKTLEHNYAVYPYDAQATLTEQGVIATTIADTQLYDDQNDLQYAVMVAKSATTSLNFTNAASLLRCHLNTAIGGTTLTSIKVVSASKAIAGAVEIDMAEENPVAVVTNGVQEITLDTEDTELTDAYTVFNIALAANEFPAGDLKVVYTVMIDGEEQTFEYTINSAVAFTAGAYKQTKYTFDESFEGNTSGVKTYSEQVTEALAAGQDVTLVEDVELPAGLVLTSGDVTLNLNGKTLTYTGDDVLFRSYGATVTIDGSAAGSAIVTNPTTPGSGGNGYVAFVKDGGVINFVGGVFDAQNTCTIAQATAGTINVYGGEFKVNTEEWTDENGNARYLFNCNDAAFKNGTAVINIEGGTFHKFNPANNAAEGAGTNFVAEGFVTVESEAGVWTVVSAATPVEVASAEALVSVLNQGGTAVVESNIVLSEQTAVNIAKGASAALTINEGVTITIPVNDKIDLIKNYGTMTLSGKGTIVAENNINSRRCIYNYGEMVIDGVTFVQTYDSKGAAINNEGKMTINDATVNSMYYAIWNAGANTELTINGGNFICQNEATSTNGKAWCYAVTNQNGAKMTINGGYFEGGHGVIACYGGGKVELNAGTFNCTGSFSGNSDWALYAAEEGSKITYDAANCTITNDKNAAGISITEENGVIEAK